MKDFLKIIGCFILFILLFVIAPGFVGGIEQTYTRNGEIKEIRNEETVIEDNQGFVWVITDNDEFEVGDKVKMKMFSNYTDNIIEDDEILKVTKR